MILYKLKCESYGDVLFDDLYCSKENAIKAGKEFLSMSLGAPIENITTSEPYSIVHFNVNGIRDYSIEVEPVETVD